MPRNRDGAQNGGAAARLSGADLTPFRVIAESVGADGGDLVERVSALIEQAQAFGAAQVSATLTLRNWYIGRMIDVAVLRESRAGPDQELVASQGRQLTARYGQVQAQLPGADELLREVAGPARTPGGREPAHRPGLVHRRVAVTRSKLLELHKDGIVGSEYWTPLPSKAELQARCPGGLPGGAGADRRKAAHRSGGRH